MTKFEGFRVAKKNEQIVEAITDHNEGYPNQRNNGHYYRYEVEFVNGETYESDRKSHIEYWITNIGKNDTERILQEAKENELEDDKKWQERLALQKEALNGERKITIEEKDYCIKDAELMLKAVEKINQAHKPVKTLQKYRVYDLLEGREVLGHADTMEQVHAIAQEQYDDTDGDCDVHYAELNPETNKYKFSFVKRVMLKGND